MGGRCDTPGMRTPRTFKSKDGTILFKDLSTILPDGTQVFTPWLDNCRFVLPNQLTHAEKHREKVIYRQAFRTAEEEAAV